jgi:hypothetical protein
MSQPLNDERQPFLDRRSFLLGAASGLLVAGGVAGLWAWRHLQPPHPTPVTGLFTGKPGRYRPAQQAMPGLYPGSVVEVRDERSVTRDNRIVPEVVAAMVDRGMAALVGGDPRDVAGVWKTFFGPDDYVGIKVNPVGRKPKPGENRNPNAVEAISSPALLVRVVECLRAAGVKAERIFVFERYADEFIATGYADLLTTRPLDGVRWLASSAAYSTAQVAIDGFDESRDSYSPELARHVVGYDPDVYTTMGYCSRAHDAKDDRRFRSHLSTIVTKFVDKIITLPVLKDHRSAGVTLALKNMSHGMNNNVARSHLPGLIHGMVDGVPTGPNQCNTFIPQAVSQELLRRKATLHILDGLIGVYEGGPGSWNKTWGTWRHGGLFFATDPVALDHVGWTIIDEKRRELGWPPVSEMGLQNYPYSAHVRAAMARFTLDPGLPAATLALASQNLMDGRGSEVFNLRQPDHVILAGEMGLGKFARDEIAYRLL